MYARGLVGGVYHRSRIEGGKRMGMVAKRRKRREGNDVELVKRPLRACESYWRKKDSHGLAVR